MHNPWPAGRIRPRTCYIRASDSAPDVLYPALGSGPRRVISGPRIRPRTCYNRPSDPAPDVLYPALGSGPGRVISGPRSRSKSYNKLLLNYGDFVNEFKLH